MDDLKSKIEQILDDKAQSLPANITSTLNQSRQEALMSQSRKSPKIVWLLPVALSFVTLGLFVLPNMQTPSIVDQTNELNYAAVVDMEILEDYEVIEDLEFYQWLSEVEDITTI